MMTYVIFGSLINLCEPQFLRLYNGENNAYCLTKMKLSSNLYNAWFTNESDY